LQNEREQFGIKLEAILSQKENDALTEKKNIEVKIEGILKEKEEIKANKNEIQKQFDTLKEQLITHMKSQIDYLHSNDSRSTGSTGESSKLTNVTLPTIKSESSEYIKALDKIFERSAMIEENKRDENEAQAKIPLEELKNWEDKVSKLKGKQFRF
jgi:transcription elongation factor Elf1